MTEENKYFALSMEDLEAEIQREEREKRELQERIRNLKAARGVRARATAARWRGRPVPYNAFNYALNFARAGSTPDSGYYRRMTRYGFSRDDAGAIYYDLYTGAGEAVEFEPLVESPEQTEEAIRVAEERIKTIDAELKKKDEAKKRPKRLQRIWEFIRYFRYKRDNPRSNKNLNFEVRIPLPFPAEYTEKDVAKFERTADVLADAAMEQFFHQPEVKAWLDPETWDTLRDDVAWDSVARGWEPSKDTEPMSRTREVAVEAIVEDKTGYWCSSGPVRFRLEGETWTIPDWTS